MTVMIEIALSDNSTSGRPGGRQRVVVLDDDAARPADLRRRFGPAIRVEDLTGRFDRLYARLHRPLVADMANVARRVPRDLWWAGQVASRSSTATHLMRNVICLHAADEFLREAGQDDLLFLCADIGLARAVASACRRRGIAYRLNVPLLRRAAMALRDAGQLAVNAALAVRDFLNVRRLRRILPPPKLSDQSRPRAVIRTWVTSGAFDADGRYVDRHFGPLPDHLRSRGYDVLVVPMFFNLDRPMREQFELMAKSGQEFLVPQHHVGLCSLLRLMAGELRRLCLRFGRVEVEGLDVGPILRHENRKDVLNPSLLRLNLVRPLLAALRRRGVRIDLMLYPFENNAPEKQFILAKQAHYAESTIVACQHSVWLSRQAGAELAPEEADVHPLPDRIVALGRVYTDVLARLGFPADRIRLGAALRFAHVQDYPAAAREPDAAEPRLFVPLPFCGNTSLDMLTKLREAIGDDRSWRVRIKTHPLLPEATLRGWLDELAYPNVEIVGEPTGRCLHECDVALAAGTSVTQMEAIVCGVPLVRVVPSNTFFLDPMKWMDYPLDPAETAAELRNRLQRARRMTADELREWSDRVRRDYFEPPSDEALSAYFGGGSDGGM
ncbi:MAG: hypothetical protein JXL80_09525 [Planctomycetes bacterium]|nr:hypothetical protein [Planctomycetota bacterium]